MSTEFPSSRSRSDCRLKLRTTRALSKRRLFRDRKNIVLTTNDLAGPAKCRRDMTIRLKSIRQRKPSQVALPRAGDSLQREVQTVMPVARKTTKTRLLPTRRVTTKPRPSQVSLLFWSLTSLGLTPFGNAQLDEDKTRYLIAWKGTDADGKPWEPTWVGLSCRGSDPTISL